MKREESDYHGTKREVKGKIGERKEGKKEEESKVKEEREKKND